MTDEQILELVKKYFTEGAIHDDGSCSEWYGNTDAFVKFARDIRQDGYSEGYDDGMFQAKSYFYDNSWE
jgi:hypothetical protein